MTATTIMATEDDRRERRLPPPPNGMNKLMPIRFPRSLRVLFFLTHNKIMDDDNDLPAGG